MDEVILRFNRNNVRYILIGGQAMRLKGMPRFSMDWDFYIPPHDTSNVKLINSLLEDILDIGVVTLGDQGENVVQTYQTEWGILQFHLGGPGLPDFTEAESRAVFERTEAGIEVRCLSGKDLLNSKRASNRPQDKQDIRFLEKKLEKDLLK